MTATLTPAGPTAGGSTPEPPHRINQDLPEPVLLHHTAALPGVTLLNRTQITGFSQQDGGVQAEALDLTPRPRAPLRARYLVAATAAARTMRADWRQAGRRP